MQPRQQDRDQRARRPGEMDFIPAIDGAARPDVPRKRSNGPSTGISIRTGISRGSPSADQTSVPPRNVWTTFRSRSRTTRSAVAPGAIRRALQVQRPGGGRGADRRGIDQAQPHRAHQLRERAIHRQDAARNRAVFQGGDVSDGDRAAADRAFACPRGSPAPAVPSVIAMICEVAFAASATRTIAGWTCTPSHTTSAVTSSCSSTAAASPGWRWPTASCG